MESLRPLGVEFDVLFINGRESTWNYLRGIRQVRKQLRAKPYDLIHAHFGLSGWVARWQCRVPVVVSFMGDDVLGRPTRSGRITLAGQFLQISGFILARLANVRDCEVTADGVPACACPPRTSFPTALTSIYSGPWSRRRRAKRWASTRARNLCCFLTTPARRASVSIWSRRQFPRDAHRSC